MIAIIDYGMGNLRSVEKGFEKIGVKVVTVNDPCEVDRADGVVLPGVGAFADAMDNLNRTGLGGAVKRAINRGRPFLGICLGLQMLFDASDEWGYSEGLGIFPGTVRRLPKKVKVPHMGWNQVRFIGRSPLFRGVPDNSNFYFVHSYYVDPIQREIETGITEYGMQFTSAVGFKNIFAIQFHPEKSSALGLQVLRNFGGIVERC